jgi:putative heme iron utilization protein
MSKIIEQLIVGFGQTGQEFKIGQFECGGTVGKVITQIKEHLPDELDNHWYFTIWSKDELISKVYGNEYTIVKYN